MKSLIVWLGILVHVIFFISIFDVYFTSPVIRGVTPISNNVAPLAKRIVLISVDGLRYDALIETDPETGRKVAPYLSFLMSGRSAWTISQTHLPTESRPGHVAFLAGFYEDPSAVTKGWKENPVDFDSIFNQSGCSFAWGSPDIVDIFYKDLKHPCSYKWTYDHGQDFAGNTMDLDNWVWDKVVQFFESEGNSTIFNKPKALFFLHLLGQDTSGHTHKPKTNPYRENLSNVDRIVQKVVGIFEQTFRDNKTAFVLTSDHGMTDWGSHGAGDPSETLTPLVAWGSGIRISKSGQEVPRIDQADIVPMLAILLGVSIPVNSVGVLPAQFLNMSKLQTSEAFLLNIKQVCSQYIVKRREVEYAIPLLLYKSFPSLDANSLTELLSSISSDIYQGAHSDALAKGDNLLKLCFKGIKYYHNYFQVPLFVGISLCYTAWIILLFLSVSNSGNIWSMSSVRILFLSIIVVVCLYLAFRLNLPLTYYLYIVMLTLLFLLVTPQFYRLLSIVASGLTFRAMILVIIIIVGIELSVFGFFHRWAHSINLFITILWLLCNSSSAIFSSKVPIIWMASGIGLALFTVLPAIGKHPDPVLPLCSAFITGGLAIITKQNNSSKHAVWIWIRIAGIFLSGINSYIIHSSFGSSSKINAINHSVSWALLLLTIPLLFEPAVEVLEKLHNVFTALCIPFILLSISHESFFLLFLTIHISCWVQVELKRENMVFSTNITHRQYTRKSLHEDSLSSNDARRAFSFLIYVFIAFFGVGNLATLNSFDPAWVRCFLTTFSPLIMTSLILLKVLIPFFIVVLALRALTLALNLSPSRVFTCLLIYLNVMGFNFLFFVTNEGSWLDIGTSLSHYIIQQVTIVFLLALYFLAHLVINPKVGQLSYKYHYP